MKRVFPPAPNLPADHAPEPEWVVVDQRLEKAHLLNQKEAIKAFLREMSAKYWRLKLRDEASATPGQVRDYAKRMAEAAAVLHPQNTEEATMLRAVLDPLVFADWVEGIETLVDDLNELAAEAGEPGTGSGPRLMHRRQLALARRFRGTFVAKGWDTGTSKNSLTAQLLGTVLAAFDEDRGVVALLKESELNT